MHRLFLGLFIISLLSGVAHFVHSYESTKVKCMVCRAQVICGLITAKPLLCYNASPCTQMQLDLCKSILWQEVEEKCDRPGVFPAADYNNKYYRCWIPRNFAKLTKQKKECPPGTTFDPLALICLKEEDRKLVNKIEHTMALRKSSFKRSPCTHPGVYSYPTDCKKYYTCDEQNQRKELYCPYGTYFDNVKRNCTSTLTPLCTKKLNRLARIQKSNAVKIKKILIHMKKGETPSELCQALCETSKPVAVKTKYTDVGGVQRAAHGAFGKLPSESIKKFKTTISELSNLTENTIKSVTGRRNSALQTKKRKQNSIMSRIMKAVKSNKLIQKLFTHKKKPPDQSEISTNIFILTMNRPLQCSSKATDSTNEDIFSNHENTGTILKDTNKQIQERIDEEPFYEPLDYLDCREETVKTVDISDDAPEKYNSVVGNDQTDKFPPNSGVTKLPDKSHGKNINEFPENSDSSEKSLLKKDPETTPKSSETSEYNESSEKSLLKKDPETTTKSSETSEYNESSEKSLLKKDPETTPKSSETSEYNESSEKSLLKKDPETTPKSSESSEYNESSTKETLANEEPTPMYTASLDLSSVTATDVSPNEEEIKYTRQILEYNYENEEILPLEKTIEENTYATEKYSSHSSGCNVKCTLPHETSTDGTPVYNESVEFTSKNPTEGPVTIQSEEDMFNPLQLSGSSKRNLLPLTETTDKVDSQKFEDNSNQCSTNSIENTVCNTYASTKESAGNKQENSNKSYRSGATETLPFVKPFGKHIGEKPKEYNSFENKNNFKKKILPLEKGTEKTINFESQDNPHPPYEYNSSSAKDIIRPESTPRKSRSEYKYESRPETLPKSMRPYKDYTYNSPGSRDKKDVLRLMKPSGKSIEEQPKDYFYRSNKYIPQHTMFSENARYTPNAKERDGTSYSPMKHIDSNELKTLSSVTFVGYQDKNSSDTVSSDKHPVLSEFTIFKRGVRNEKLPIDNLYNSSEQSSNNEIGKLPVLRPTRTSNGMQPKAYLDGSFQNSWQQPVNTPQKSTEISEDQLQKYSDESFQYIGGSERHLLGIPVAKGLGKNVNDYRDGPLMYDRDGEKHAIRPHFVVPKNKRGRDAPGHYSQDSQRQGYSNGQFMRPTDGGRRSQAHFWYDLFR